MKRNFKNEATKRLLLKMVGTLTPVEIAEIIEDREVMATDIPQWIEIIVQENCGMVLNRLRKYEEAIQAKYGQINFTIQKLALYHRFWTNWDGEEPCPFNESVPLRMFYDEQIKSDQKKRNKY